MPNFPPVRNCAPQPVAAPAYFRAVNYLSWPLPMPKTLVFHHPTHSHRAQSGNWSAQAISCFLRQQRETEYSQPVTALSDARPGQWPTVTTPHESMTDTPRTLFGTRSPLATPRPHPAQHTTKREKSDRASRKSVWLPPKTLGLADRRRARPVPADFGAWRKKAIICRKGQASTPAGPPAQHLVWVWVWVLEVWYARKSLIYLHRTSLLLQTSSASSGHRNGTILYLVVNHLLSCIILIAKTFTHQYNLTSPHLQPPASHTTFALRTSSHLVSSLSPINHIFLSLRLSIIPPPRNYKLVSPRSRSKPTAFCAASYHSQPISSSASTHLAMSHNMEWSPDFCLACDRQTDGSVYCGEACRLADYEKANSGSEASSPTSQRGSIQWPTTRPSNNFFLPPAYNFAAYKSQPHGSTRTSQSYISRPKSSPMVASKPLLTPSSSQSSLFSMRSSSSTSSEPTQLTEEAQRELRAYASSFDRSRYQRRQSTY